MDGHRGSGGNKLAGLRYDPSHIEAFRFSLTLGLARFHGAVDSLVADLRQQLNEIDAERPGGVAGATVGTDPCRSGCRSGHVPVSQHPAPRRNLHRLRSSLPLRSTARTCCGGARSCCGTACAGCGAARTFAVQPAPSVAPIPVAVQPAAVAPAPIEIAPEVAQPAPVQPVSVQPAPVQPEPVAVQPVAPSVLPGGRLGLNPAGAAPQAPVQPTLAQPGAGQGTAGDAFGHTRTRVETVKAGHRQVPILRNRVRSRPLAGTTIPMVRPRPGGGTVNSGRPIPPERRQHWRRTRSAQ